MSCYSKLLKDCQEYLDVLRYINSGVAPSGITGLPPTPKAHLIHSLCEDTLRRAIVILPSEGAATNFVNDINEFCGTWRDFAACEFISYFCNVFDFGFHARLFDF